MKALKYFIVLIWAICLFTGCEQKVSVETVVHPDGSLDRTIILEKADTSQIDRNFFGISRKSGWEIELDTVRSQEDSMKATKKRKKLIIRFKKHFSSYQESNKELNSKADTIFKVRANFEKRFRWFYTYLYYSDSYIDLDRLEYVSQDDYFTREDHAFIDRLPAEGKEISKADKLFLEKLQEKTFEDYFSRGIFEEEYNLLLALMRMHDLEPRWADTLRKHKEPVYSNFMNQGGVADSIALYIADSLSIPLPRPQADNDYGVLSKDLRSRLDFFSNFSNTRFKHNIKMPWPVIRSNADSVSGSHLFWQPPVTKFLIKDYEMYAESRKMNYWAVVVSVMIIILTALLFAKKRPT
ncbi:MAG: hypothetical protein F6K42_35835 [Leptolyngbya sp. SIO1D8]|nr:hypothetical protein [Leptolyngbya sp. SIO1D8]